MGPPRSICTTQTGTIPANDCVSLSARVYMWQHAICLCWDYESPHSHSALKSSSEPRLREPGSLNFSKDSSSSLLEAHVLDGG